MNLENWPRRLQLHFTLACIFFCSYNSETSAQRLEIFYTQNEMKSYQSLESLCLERIELDRPSRVNISIYKRVPSNEEQKLTRTALVEE